MNEGVRALLAFVSAAFGLAIISVILSNQANTAGVIGAGGSALSGVIQAATGPVTGNSGTSSFSANNLAQYSNLLLGTGALGSGLG